MNKALDIIKSIKRLNEAYHGIKLSPTYDDFVMSDLEKLGLTTDRFDWDGEVTYALYSDQPPKGDIDKVKKYASREDFKVSIY